MVLVGTGKRTFDVSKELTVNGPLRDGTTVDRNIFLVLAGTVVEYNLRKMFLACSALTDDEYREVDLCHPQRALNSSVQARCLSYDGVTLLNLLHLCRHIILFCHNLNLQCTMLKASCTIVILLCSYGDKADASYPINC